MQTKIIYEDDHVLVCHKPAGLATQSGRVGQPDVESELKKYLNTTGKREAKGQAPYLGIVHRLDQPVEGLLVFAKTKKAAAHLTKQLGEGSLNKQYYAMVCGQPVKEAGELVDYLTKDGNVARVVDGQTEGAKKAVLQYKVVEGPVANGPWKAAQDSSSGEVKSAEKVVLLDIHIETGRFHQIRAQMSHARMPLLGDSKYGTEESMTLSRQLGIGNVALCAYAVEFMHPVSGKKLNFNIQPQFLRDRFFA